MMGRRRLAAALLAQLFCLASSYPQGTVPSGLPQNYQVKTNGVITGHHVSGVNQDRSNFSHSIYSSSPRESSLELHGYLNQKWVQNTDAADYLASAPVVDTTFANQKWVDGGPRPYSYYYRQEIVQKAIGHSTTTEWPVGLCQSAGKNNECFTIEGQWELNDAYPAAIHIKVVGTAQAYQGELTGIPGPDEFMWKYTTSMTKTSGHQDWQDTWIPIQGVPKPDSRDGNSWRATNLSTLQTTTNTTCDAAGVCSTETIQDWGPTGLTVQWHVVRGFSIDDEFKMTSICASSGIPADVTTDKHCLAVSGTFAPVGTLTAQPAAIWIRVKGESVYPAPDTFEWSPTDNIGDWHPIAGLPSENGLGTTSAVSLGSTALQYSGGVTGLSVAWRATEGFNVGDKIKIGTICDVDGFVKMGNNSIECFRVRRRESKHVEWADTDNSPAAVHVRASTPGSGPYDVFQWKRSDENDASYAIAGRTFAYIPSEVATPSPLGNMAGDSGMIGNVLGTSPLMDGAIDTNLYIEWHVTQGFTGRGTSTPQAVKVRTICEENSGPMFVQSDLGYYAEVFAGGKIQVDGTTWHDIAVKWTPAATASAIPGAGLFLKVTAITTALVTGRLLNAGVSAAVTGITMSAGGGVVTATGHTYAGGETIRFGNIGGMPTLNYATNGGTEFKVCLPAVGAIVAITSFTVCNADGTVLDTSISPYTAFAASGSDSVTSFSLSTTYTFENPPHSIHTHGTCFTTTGKWENRPIPGSSDVQVDFLNTQKLFLRVVDNTVTPNTFQWSRALADPTVTGFQPAQEDPGAGTSDALGSGVATNARLWFPINNMPVAAGDTALEYPRLKSSTPTSRNFYGQSDGLCKSQDGQGTPAQGGPTNWRWAGPPATTRATHSYKTPQCMDLLGDWDPDAAGRAAPEFIWIRCKEETANAKSVDFKHKHCMNTYRDAQPSSGVSTECMTTATWPDVFEWSLDNTEWHPIYDVTQFTAKNGGPGNWLPDDNTAAINLGTTELVYDHDQDITDPNKRNRITPTPNLRTGLSLNWHVTAGYVAGDTFQFYVNPGTGVTVQWQTTSGYHLEDLIEVPFLVAEKTLAAAGSSTGGVQECEGWRCTTTDATKNTLTLSEVFLDNNYIRMRQHWEGKPGVIRDLTVSMTTFDRFTVTWLRPQRTYPVKAGESVTIDDDISDLILMSMNIHDPSDYNETILPTRGQTSYTQTGLLQCTQYMVYIISLRGDETTESQPVMAYTKEKRYQRIDPEDAAFNLGPQLQSPATDEFTPWSATASPVSPYSLTDHGRLHQSGTDAAWVMPSGTGPRSGLAPGATGAGSDLASHRVENMGYDCISSMYGTQTFQGVDKYTNPVALADNHKMFQKRCSSSGLLDC